MWTKRYILKPTKEEYFKGKHPIATGSVVVPMIIFYLIISFAGADSYNWWIGVGFVGSLIFGMSLSFAFAVKVKIYQKVWPPIIFLILGLILVVASLIFLF